MDLGNFELIEHIELTEASKIEDRDSYIYLKNKYGNRANELFVSFTSIPKLGINPQSKWDTPNGIYAYPISYYFKVHGAVEFKSYEKDGVRYINVFKPKDIIIDKVINGDLTESQYQSLIDKIKNTSELVKMCFNNTDVLKTYNAFIEDGSYSDEDSIKGALDFHIRKYENESKIKTPLGFLWNVTRVLSANNDNVNTKNSNKWTSFFIKLGIYGVINNNGEGIIHNNEKTQAVFFNVSFLDVLDRIQDKQIDIRIPKDKINNTNVLSKITSFMEYIKAHEGDWNNTITNSTFLAMLEQIPTARNYFKNNLDDFEVLIIYINLAVDNNYDPPDHIFKCIAKIIENNKPLTKIFLKNTSGLRYGIIYQIAKNNSNLGDLLYEHIKNSNYFLKQLQKHSPLEMVDNGTEDYADNKLLDLLLQSLYSIHAQKYIDSINSKFDGFMSHLISKTSWEVNKIILILLDNKIFLNKFIKWLPDNINDVEFDLISLYNSNNTVNNSIKEIIKKDGHVIANITNNIDDTLFNNPELKESVVNYIINDYAPVLTFNKFFNNKGIEIISYCLQHYPEYKKSFIRDAKDSSKLFFPSGFLKENFNTIELIQLNAYQLIEDVGDEEISYIVNNLENINLASFNKNIIKKILNTQEFQNKIFENNEAFKVLVTNAAPSIIKNILALDKDKFFYMMRLFKHKEILSMVYNIIGDSEIFLEPEYVDQFVDLVYYLNAINDRTIRYYTADSELYANAMAKHLNNKITHFISKMDKEDNDSKEILNNTFNQVISYNTAIMNRNDNESGTFYKIPLGDLNEDYLKYADGIVKEKFPSIYSSVITHLESASDMKSKLKNKLFTILNEVVQ